MCDAQLIIFNEPTSAMSVHQNTNYLCLSGNYLTAGPFDCHPFLTVHMTDLICVMEAGRVVEQGSYDELMCSRRALRAILRDAGPGITAEKACCLF